MIPLLLVLATALPAGSQTPTPRPRPAAASRARLAKPTPRPRVPIAARTRAMTNAGRWDEAAETLEKELAAAVRRRDPRAEAALRVEQARVLLDRNFFHRQDTNSARRALEQAVVAARRSEDEKLQAEVTQYLGQLHYGEAFATGEWDKPRTFFQEALELRTRLRDNRGLSETIFYLGLTWEQAGQPDAALANYNRALFLAQEAEDKVLESYARRHIGGIQEERGQLAAAEQNIRRSLQLRRLAGWTVAVPFALIQLADFVERRKNDPDEAVRLLEEAVRVATEAGSARARQAARMELARLALARGDAPGALAHAEAALEAAREFGDPKGIEAARARVEEARAPAASNP